ncbi:hypothetical protein Efla_000671 [Eimeria flavescens]
MEAHRGPRNSSSSSSSSSSANSSSSNREGSSGASEGLPAALRRPVGFRGGPFSSAAKSDSSSSAAVAAAAAAEPSAAARAATPAADAAATAAAAAAREFFSRDYSRPFSRGPWDGLWGPRISFAVSPGGHYWGLCSLGGPLGARSPELQPPKKPSKRSGGGEGGLPWWRPWGLSLIPLLPSWLGPLVLGGGLAVGFAVAGKLLGVLREGPVEASFSQFLLWLKRGELQQVTLHQVNAEQFVYFRVKPEALGGPSQAVGGPPGALKHASTGRGPTDFVAKMLPGAEALVAQLLVAAVAGQGAHGVYRQQQPGAAAGAAAAAAAAADTLHVQALPSTATFAFWDLVVLAISLSGLLILAGTQFQWLQRPSWGRADGEALEGSRPRVTFADVAGRGALKARLLQAAELLTNPEAYSWLGARPPRGILLEGPTGTGKTLAARALAGEAGVPFLYASASSFVEVYAGRGAARIRRLFADASRLAPSVVFLDEIDAIGAHRYSGSGACQEYVQTLNQLLTLMDGLETSGKRILVLAATNRVDCLDEALLRPGRFDQIIQVSLPDEEERLSILSLHFRGVPLHPGVSLSDLSVSTEGLSGASLAALSNEAALLAARRGLSVVGPREVSEALQEVKRADRCSRGPPGGSPGGPSKPFGRQGPRAAAAAAAATAAPLQQQQQPLRRRINEEALSPGDRQASAAGAVARPRSKNNNQQQQLQQQLQQQQQQQQQQDDQELLLTEQQQQLSLAEEQLRVLQERLLRELSRAASADA